MLPELEPPPPPAPVLLTAHVTIGHDIAEAALTYDRAIDETTPNFASTINFHTAAGTYSGNGADPDAFVTADTVTIQLQLLDLELGDDTVTYDGTAFNFTYNAGTPMPAFENFPTT